MYAEDLKKVNRLTQKADEMAANGMPAEAEMYANAALASAQALQIALDVMRRLPSKPTPK